MQRPRREGIDGVTLGDLLIRHHGTLLFAARLAGNDRVVTVKMPDGEPTAEDRERFEHERRLLDLFDDHHGVVRLRDVTSTRQGRPCLVLEAGVPMQAAAPPLTLNSVHRVLATGVVIAAALETMHRGGFVHRDVGAESILLTPYDEPRLAHLASARPAAAQPKGLDGISLAYAAPEVCAGQPASPGADVYALAATLFALLAGAPPYGDPTTEPSGLAAGLLRIRTDPVPRLHAAGVPAPVSELLARAMGKVPADRPRSALALGRELQALQANLGLAPTPCLVAGEPPVDDSLPRPGTAATTGPARGALDASDAEHSRRSSGPRVIDPPPPRARHREPSAAIDPAPAEPPNTQPVAQPAQVVARTSRAKTPAPPKASATAGAPDDSRWRAGIVVPLVAVAAVVAIALAVVLLVTR